MHIRKPNLNSIRSSLLKRRAGLLNILDQDLSRFAIRDGYAVGDSGDGAVEDEYQNISARLSHAESRELSLINDALHRIKIGDYGFCEECGEEIAAERLKAIPFVATCIQCQEEVDRSGRRG